MTSQLGDGCDCHGDALYSALVHPAPDAEVTIFAPAGSPAVLHDPVLLPGLLTLPITDQQHCVIGQLKWIDGVTQAGVMVDAIFVVHEVGVNLEGHAHWAVIYQLDHHGCFAASSVEAAYVVVIGDVIARTVGRNRAGRVFAGVREALLLDYAEVLHVFTDQVREATVTT